MRKTGPTNEHLNLLIADLKRQSHSNDAAIWKRIALDLEVSSRRRRVVNLSRINRSTRENETVVVPGKVLGSGSIDHSIMVAAFSFSGSAKEQIERAKGKCMSIAELVKKNPSGKDVRILG